jgi:miniconductance mechanosensitive channel
MTLTPAHVATTDPDAWLIAFVDAAAPALSWLADYPAAQSAAAAAIILAVAMLVYGIARMFVGTVLNAVTRRMPELWTTELREHAVLLRVIAVLPVIVVNRGVLLVPHLPDLATVFVQRIMLATLALLGARAVSALLDAIHAIYQRYPIARGRPIKGYVQVVRILLYALAGILIVAALADQSPWFFISGLGAMTAIIMLIFRDTILSFVAGIQLVNNDLVRVGDWIEMPQFNADGDVVDISLIAVKVRNFDSTITLIPTHRFLDNSFKNWRGMFESGGRRVMRSLHVDMTTVRFLNDTEIERFERFLLLKDYIRSKRRELDAWNAANCPDEFADVSANARHLTNIGTFRAYITEYLRRHPDVHQDRVFLIRQLEPTPHGLPLQVYIFLKETRWVYYEGIQSDIFDHMLAVAPEFGLRVYQQPSGYDFQRLNNGAAGAHGELTPQLAGGATPPHAELAGMIDGAPR